jgi:hypothetical protein
MTAQELLEKAHDAMRMSTRISRAGWAVAGALALAVSGCGSSSGPSAAAPANNVAKPKVVKAAQPSAMVAAVSATKAGPPVELKFDLQQRPAIGQAVDIAFELVPASPNVERVSAKFQADDGLELVGGSDIPPVEKPAEGTPIRHIASIVAKRDGIFTLHAVVSVESEKQTLTRTFTIPVIAGEGLTELAAKSEVAEGRATTAAAPGTRFKAQ